MAKRYTKRNLTSGMRSVHFAYEKEHLKPDQLGEGNSTKIMILTQAEYDGMPEHDPDTLYFIKA